MFPLIRSPLGFFRQFNGIEVGSLEYNASFIGLKPAIGAAGRMAGRGRGAHK